MGEYTETLGNEIGVPASEIAENAIPAVNSLVTPVNSNIVSEMHSGAEGCIRITRREFVNFVDIKESVTSYEYYIEPSRAPTFPWLASIATNWQQWQMLGCAFEYVPTSGLAVGTDSGALGQVIMAMRYNTTEDANVFPTLVPAALLNQSGAVSMSPATPGTCYLECDPEQTNQPVKFVRRNGSLGAYSTQNYEGGVLMVNTSGAQSAGADQCGQLWVTYDILLYHPTMVEPIIPLPLIVNDPVYLKYLPLYEQLEALSMHVGPYSQDEAIVRLSMMETLKAQLRTTEFVERRAYWDAVKAACETVVAAGSTNQPLLDLIRTTDLYKLVCKINPPEERPPRLNVSRAETENWETVSTVGRF